jgi:Fe-coproporphyrin III synthase
MKFASTLLLIMRNLKIWIYKLSGKTDRLLPYKLMISLTDRCNSRCVFCDIWKKNENARVGADPEINLENIITVFKDLDSNLVALSLTGGEVTLVHYFKEMIVAARKYCRNMKLVSFTTNGLLPDKALEYAAFVKNAGLDIVVLISMDGDETLHDRVRNIPGNYKKCLRTYELLKENNIKCNYCLTVNSLNHGFIESETDTIKNAIRTFSFVHSDGIYGKKNDVDYEIILKSLKHVLKNYKPKSIEEWIEKIYLGIGVLFLSNRRSANIIPCEVLTSHVHITATGEIKPCMYLPSLGNVKRDKVSVVYGSEATGEARLRIRQGECAHCWMSCYCQYSIMQHPLRSILAYLKSTI